LQVPIPSSPGYSRNRIESLSPLQSIHDLHQSFLPLPPDNHINPGMIMEDILVIKGNMGPPHTVTASGLRRLTVWRILDAMGRLMEKDVIPTT
jgi:hypothetical protein